MKMLKLYLDTCCYNRPFDALHIAIAEINKLDYFISTDKKLNSLSKKEGKNMLIFIRNPLEFIKEYYYAE